MAPVASSCPLNGDCVELGHEDLHHRSLHEHALATRHRASPANSRRAQCRSPQRHKDTSASSLAHISCHVTGPAPVQPIFDTVCPSPRSRHHHKDDAHHSTTDSRYLTMSLTVRTRRTASHQRIQTETAQTRAAPMPSTPAAPQFRSMETLTAPPRALHDKFAARSTQPCAEAPLRPESGPHIRDAYTSPRVTEL